MNIQEDQSNPHKHIDLRMRTLRTLWLALFFSVGFYYVLTLFVRRNENAVPNNTLSITLVMVALSATLISFIVKNKLLARAVEQQQVQMVQQAYVVAWAINDVAALLGFLDFLMSGNRYYYVPFLIAAAGQLLHFPRREHVENAAFKRTTS